VSENDVITVENFKEKFVSLYVLKPREIALSSLEEGLTLNRKLNLPFLLPLVPSRVVNAMFFSNPNFKAEDVISVLNPNYTDFKDDKEVDEESAASIRTIQQDCFERRLPKVIKQLSIETSNSLFLSKFLSFCTGSSYLPCKENNPGYSINVSFEKSLDEKNLLPTANTCDNNLNLPLYGYHYNGESALEEKLSKAVELGCETFGFE